METAKIIDLVSYTFPAIVTGLIAFYLFRAFLKNENRKKVLQLKNNHQITLPLRLQAYERMTLFLERISPSKFISRIQPVSEDKNVYETLLVQSIEREFEHNLAQQIYISDRCWNVIVTAKNTTITMIRKAAKERQVKNAGELREKIIQKVLHKQAPSAVALAFIKEEVRILF